MKKRTRKRNLSLLLSMAALGCMLLSGCSLAREELQEVKGEEEKLCGVLVTIGEQEAQRKKETELSQETFHSVKELEESFLKPLEIEGTRQEDGTILFDGIEGNMIGIFDEEEDGEACTHFMNRGSFTDVKANTNVTDEGTSRQMKAVILATNTLREPIYMNPVFERSDGTIYVRLDQVGYLAGGAHDEGELYGNTFSYETTKEVNGKKETVSSEFEVSIRIAKAVKSARMKEMNEKDEVLAGRELSLESGQVILQNGTAYVIVEETLEDGTIQRSIYDWDAQQAENGGLFHTLNVTGTYGIIEPKTLTFQKE